jgi:hypothetical protein
MCVHSMGFTLPLHIYIVYALYVLRQNLHIYILPVDLARLLVTGFL